MSLRSRTKSAVRTAVLLCTLLIASVSGATDYIPASISEWIYIAASSPGVLGCFTSESAARASENSVLTTNYDYPACGGVVDGGWVGPWPNTSTNTGGSSICPPASTPNYNWGIQHQEQRQFNYKLHTSGAPSCPVGASSYTDAISRHFFWYCGDNTDYSLTSVSGTPVCARRTTSVNLPKQPRGGCPNGNCPVGNPIDPSTGIKFQGETDYAAAGPFPLAFTRVYNSFGAAPSLAIGGGWRHSFERSVQILIDTGTFHAVQVHRPDGRILPFEDSSGSLKPEDDVPTSLSRQVSGGVTSGWVYMDENDTVESFDASGRLLTIRSRGGITQTMAYNGSGQLTSVTDSFGRQLSFTYTGGGLLSTMSDPASGVFQYAYDGSGRLASVTFPDSTVRQYLYNESTYTSGASLPNALTGILDENTARYATYTYDSQGRGIASQHAGGADAVSLSYSSGSTSVTDPLGATRTLATTNVLNVLHVSGITGQPCLSCGDAKTYSYDARGNVQNSISPRGIQANFLYTTDGRNLQTGFTEAVGTGSQRNTTTQWHTTYRLPMQVSRNNSTTTFTYDSSGNLLTKTIADTALSVSRTWTYTYDSYGRVLTADGPRTDVTDTTTYTYYTCTTSYECGQVHTVTDAAGNVTTFNTYDAHGRPLTITDPNGVVTTLTYDSRGHLASRAVGSETTTFTYWPTGLLKRVILPDSSYLQYS